jgi:hypothetical protein
LVPQVGYVALPTDAYALAQQRFDGQATGSLFNTDAAKGKTVLDVLQSASAAGANAGTPAAE